MSDYQSNYGERDYQDYADTFAYQRELDAEELEHELEVVVDRLRRDDPVFAREGGHR